MYRILSKQGDYPLFHSQVYVVPITYSRFVVRVHKQVHSEIIHVRAIFHVPSVRYTYVEANLVNVSKYRTTAGT